ncbi:MAG: hypothetical protein WC285_03985 [Candidatus Gracilibacteria bacterium]|jgi:hypothetical protein
MKCVECLSEFEYHSGEKEVYEKLGIPLPLNCSECRQKRRMIFRNERALYYNKSFKSGKKIITIYSEETPFKVIDLGEWWDDSFDATIYGRDFDFSRPFFEQFKDLQFEVPRWARQHLNCENAEFTNNCAGVKNSYLDFSCNDCEEIYYCMKVYDCSHCLDSMWLYDSEYCSECVQSHNCYNVHYSQLSENCRDSLFLFDCRGCHDCLLCAGIRNGEYMILNQKYSKEEYEKQKEVFLKTLHSDKGKLEKLMEELKQSVIHKNTHNLSMENCTGDFISNSKNVINGFNIINCEDCVDAYNSSKLKNCCGAYCSDVGELSIDCDTNYDLYECAFCTYIVGCKNSQYLDQCFYLENCFGCVGLKRQKYMILNKQYAERDYFEMVEKIKEHMKQAGEYGKPFPATLSSFAYNETVAQDSYPLTKEQAVSQGFRWYEPKEEARHFGREYIIPDDPKEIDRSICDKILTCEISRKNYKIIQQEFDFYKKFNLPIPRRCPEQRYRDLLAIQNPTKLTDTVCSECQKKIQTTYRNDSTYKILCEECYLKRKY